LIELTLAVLPVCGDIRTRFVEMDMLVDMIHPTGIGVSDGVSPEFQRGHQMKSCEKIKVTLGPAWLHAGHSGRSPSSADTSITIDRQLAPAGSRRLASNRRCIYYFGTIVTPAH
jgi:hypothetical protein